MGEDKTIWFDSLIVGDDQQKRIEECRKLYKEFIGQLEARIGNGRRQAIVYTHLEQAASMTTKAISHG